MKRLSILLWMTLPLGLFGQLNTENPRAKTANGLVEGISSSGISIFKGIPFAQPPVGDLRWKEPQPVRNWAGIRKADKFGPRGMQHSFSDMVFRSDGMSEDCLYLNVWTAAKSSNERLPVLVYFYGGGFVSGDGSEFRYDGESMARKGIVALTVNYRLGVFGFFAHPALSKEAPYHGSGNYGLMDQQAALRWVQQNIAAFGGDPKRVTIAGESAGSISVCSQMASPGSKNLFAGAIGESGASINPTMAPVPLAVAEQNGVKFANAIGATSLAALRAIPAEKLLDDSLKPGAPKFTATIDGSFFTKSPVDIFAAGEQAEVPLLVGWNSQEMNYKMVMGMSEPTPENYKKAVEKLYGEKAGEAMKLYPGVTREGVIQSATDLASDRFIAYSTWKWCDLHSKTGNSVVYRYYYARPRPAVRLGTGNASKGLDGGGPKGPGANAPQMPAVIGAVHSAEIEYAMGNLSTNRVYDWQPEDYKISSILQEYFANFIKTGNPNGMGLPVWSPFTSDGTGKVMIIDVNTRSEDEKNRGRYLWLDQIYNPGT